MQGVLTDISEQKQAVDAFMVSEERFRLLAENARDTIWTMDLNLRYTYVSPYVQQLLDYPPEEFMNLSVNEVLTPSSLELCMQTFADELEIEKTEDKDFFRSKTVEVEHISKKGNIVNCEIKMTFIRNNAGQATGILGYTRDLTERNRANEEKVKLEKQLLQSQKMEAIGTLAGGVAHDFNNVLGAIIGYTEMAVEEDQNDTRKQYLQETLNGAERAKKLVKQILTFSRQDSQERKPLDIKLLLKEAIKFLRSSIPATIEIKQNLTDELCNIMADSTQVHQIIMNLCTNATHAMKRTGGILQIELANIEINQGDLKSALDLQPGHYIKLTISDTGHGIDPDNIQRIFDPFFTTKSVDEGTGLGLSVVYGIVKNHGGIINVTSKIDEGATFNVYLPKIIHEEVTIAKMSGSIIGGTERILFVDDEQALVDIGKCLLSSLGYDVTGVLSSVEAMNLFQTKPQSFDLIITDMTLPKMNGIVLARKILKIRPDIPILLCSGIRESDTEKQAKSLGISAYLTKPLARKELAKVVRDALDASKKTVVS